VLRTIPLRRSSSLIRPARPRNTRPTTSPLRFYALRTRCGEARHADLPLAVFAHPDAPRFGGGYNVCSQCRQRLRSSCEDRSANPIPTTLRDDPSHQAPPLRSFAVRRRSCIDACSCAMFRYRHRTFAAWPDEWSFPLFVRRRSWGSRPCIRRALPFAGLLPQRVADHFWSAGPTCLFVQSPRPD
jgi:hypothetical protein